MEGVNFQQFSLHFVPFYINSLPDFIFADAFMKQLLQKAGSSKPAQPAVEVPAQVDQGGEQTQIVQSNPGIAAVPISSQQPKRKRDEDVQITHIVEPPVEEPKGPRIKYTLTRQGKGKEIKMPGKVVLTHEEELRSAAPAGGLWSGLPTKMFRSKHKEITHSGEQFCPFQNLSINDRVGYVIPARELVTRSVLPRDKEALRNMPANDLLDMAYLAAASVSKTQ